MPDVRPAQQVLYQKVVNTLAAMAGGWALLVLLTLMAGLRFPASLGRAYVATSPLAAGLMLALSLAMLLCRLAPGRGSKGALLIGLLVGLIGLWVVAENLLGGSLPRFPEAWARTGMLRTKVSLLTAAASFGLAVGSGLVMAIPSGGWRERQAGAIVALGPLGTCLVVLVSYAAGVPLLYGGQYTPMTLPIASMGSLLSLAILVAAGPDTWPLALFSYQAGRAPSQHFRWLLRRPMAGFLLLTLGIMAGGTGILRSQLKAAGLIVQDELVAIAELKAGQIAEWHQMHEGDGQAGAAPFPQRIAQPWPHSQPSAEILLIGRDPAFAVQLSERRHPLDAVLGLRIAVAAHPDLLEVMAAQGREGLVSGLDYRGRRVAGALKRVPGTPWTVVAKVDQAELYGPMRQRIWSTGLLLLGLIALAAMAIGLVVRHQDAGRILGQLAFERERKVLAERAEAAVRASEEKFSKAFATSPDAININRLSDGVYLNISPSFTRMTGYRPEDVLGHSSRVEDCNIWVDNSDRDRLVAALRERGEVLDFEAEFRCKDGRRIIGRMSAALLEIGNEPCVLSVTRDITQFRQDERERRQLEARLQQAEKLESLGALAGGVAHDMNNVLGAILSLASSRRSGMDAADPMASALDTIATACVRGRGVVRSLLYFARKDLEETRPQNLNDLVRDMVQLLGYTTLKRISLEMELEEPLAPVLGDSGALSHALMNLAVNAVDAMPGHGTLCLRTENLAGGKVRLRVRDTGEGMSEEVLAKAIEPFYTTKPLGKGTGLGLAMVFGTMKAHGGELELHSRPGQGTEVLLTFPALDPAAPAAALAAAAQDGPGRPLAILVVDDDELIRESLVPMLGIMGHAGRAAQGGLEALDLLQGGLKVDLVILDMNMPGLNGAETLARIKAGRPGQRVLMASGYNDSEVSRLVNGHAGVSCIQKPFSMKELRHKLVEMKI